MYEKDIGIVSDSTPQLTVKKLPLVEFYCKVKEEYHIQNVIQLLLPSHPCAAEYTLQTEQHKD